MMRFISTYLNPAIYDRLRHPAFFKRRSMDLITVSHDASSMAALPSNTTWPQGSILPSNSSINALKRRRIRFLLTADPAVRCAATPNRVAGSSPVDRMKRTIKRSPKVCPCLKTRPKSARLFSRSCRCIAVRVPYTLRRLRPRLRRRFSTARPARVLIRLRNP